MIYFIVWRDRTTGNIVHTGLGEYKTWADADAAIWTLLHWFRLYTPTIETRAS